MKVIDIMQDKRSNCYSVMTRINVNDYLDIINEAYNKTGNISGQRQPITSKTGKRIREIMTGDIKKGTILPPIVLGCVIEDEQLEEISTYERNFEDVDIKGLLYNKSLSIIDGMQRTTALLEVKQNDGELVNDIRVEIWFTNSPNNLIYRMLVLNTGQISWSLKKQLEVVFSHIEDIMINQIEKIKLLTSNDDAKSAGPGEYQLSHMVELYLAFATRKESVDLSKEVTERFAKLDIVDMSSDFDYMNYFMEVIDKLVKIDFILSKDKIGKRIMGDQHARLSFVVAISKEIFGRISDVRDKATVAVKYKNIMDELNNFIIKIEGLQICELKEFCSLDVFEEITNDMGKLEKTDFYNSCFSDLVKSKFDVDSLEGCWRAY